MSRFYGTIKGQAKTDASRRGSPNSGLVAHIRGWDIGIRVYCRVDKYGNDSISVFRTGGSNDPDDKQLLGDISDCRNEEVKRYSNPTDLRAIGLI